MVEQKKNQRVAKLVDTATKSLETKKRKAALKDLPPSKNTGKKAWKADKSVNKEKRPQKADKSSNKEQPQAPNNNWLYMQFVSYYFDWTWQNVLLMSSF